MAKQLNASYISPFSWRYGSPQMREIFSEENKYGIWRSIWVALATAEYKQGLVSAEELADLKKHQGTIDVERILQIEEETKHDVVAAIREYAERATVGGRKIHLGATSMDIVDNADAIRVLEALNIVQEKVEKLLQLFSEKIEKYSNTPCMGYTHLQPAEPTTLGHRFSFYAQDLLLDLKQIVFIKSMYKTKGLKGAVGTAASYKELLGKDPEALENEVMETLGLSASLISTQVNSRKYDYMVLTILASISSSLAKFAGDVRLLQSPSIGELSEPFGKSQVGSSAMPFKRNPRMSENICSLARLVTTYPNTMLENATLSYLERTLDDSGNRRIVIPEAFLATDEILTVAITVVEGLQIHDKRITHNLSQYAPFAASESLLIQVTKKGADRQRMHELLREIAMEAWEAIQNGEDNPMKKLLLSNDELLSFLTPEQIEESFSVERHIGNAPERGLKLVDEIRSFLKALT